jgi:hypothetical protein
MPRNQGKYGHSFGVITLSITILSIMTTRITIISIAKKLDTQGINDTKQRTLTEGDG